MSENNDSTDLRLVAVFLMGLSLGICGTMLFLALRGHIRPPIQVGSPSDQVDSPTQGNQP